MKQRQPCEHCEGRGECGNGFYANDGEAETVKCQDCGGTGYVAVCTRGKECLPQDCTCSVPATNESRINMTEAQASSNCPICGIGTPHTHTPEELAEYHGRAWGDGKGNCYGCYYADGPRCPGCQGGAQWLKNERKYGRADGVAPTPEPQPPMDSYIVAQQGPQPGIAALTPEVAVEDEYGWCLLCRRGNDKRRVPHLFSCTAGVPACETKQESNDER